MALSLTKAIGMNKGGNKPLLNARIPMGNQNGRHFGMDSIQRQKKQLWDWFKTRPELNSPVFVRVNDTIKEVEFFKPDGTALGRNKRLEAERFYEENFVDDVLKSIWFDAIVAGSGFGWKGFLSDGQMKEVIDKTTEKLNVKSVEFKEFLAKAMDEELRKPRIFDYLASSTVDIDYTESEVKGFTQTVNTLTKHFTNEEIVHFPFSRVNGEVNGYTPVASLAPELILIWFIKENMMAYMRNGGVPKKLFSLAEEIANSANHEYLIQQLQTYGAVQNRHGNMVLTGKVNVIDLEEKMRDMEYEKLAKYVMGNVAYALQIPNSRLPYNLDGKANSDAGGLAEAGYWSMIQADQRKIETLMNTQVFKKLGFIMKFKEANRIDDLRETQAMSMKADAIQKMQSILQAKGKTITAAKIIRMMDFGEEDVEDAPKEEMNSFEKTGLRNQNLLNNQELARGDSSVKREKARTAAVNNPKNLPQNGV